MRLSACIEAGLKEVPVIVADELTEAQQQEFIIKDNVSFGEWDWAAIGEGWGVEVVGEWGLEFPTLEGDGAGSGEGASGDITKAQAHQKLTERFIVPPFSVLDTRQGYWSERKAHWRVLIGDNGESRESVLGGSESELDVMNAMAGASLLDPVLSELVNMWFGLPNGNSFDCFAGDSVFGFVSSYLGHSFTGIELRKEQAELNSGRIAEFTKSRYVCDDGQNVGKHIEANSQDLLFSCPPYFDLEVYSDLENDASNQKEYSSFLAILRNAFTEAIKCLKNDRFAVIVVGDIRDKKGNYRRFPDHIKDIFNTNGVLLYNEMILVESLGTLPQRVGRFMGHRKIGKCHQNVLVFFKGDPSKIKDIYPKIEVAEVQDGE